MDPPPVAGPARAARLDRAAQDGFRHPARPVAAWSVAGLGWRLAGGGPVAARGLSAPRSDYAHLAGAPSRRWQLRLSPVVGADVPGVAGSPREGRLMWPY